jgi:hypothetical protein
MKNDVAGKNLSLYASLEFIHRVSGCHHKKVQQNVTKSCKTHPKILESRLKCAVKHKKKMDFLDMMYEKKTFTLNTYVQGTMHIDNL